MSNLLLYLTLLSLPLLLYSVNILDRKYATGFSLACAVLMVFSVLFGRVRFYLRLAAFVGGLGITAGWGMIASAIMALIGQRGNAHWFVARSFYNFVGPIVGVKFRIEGQEILEQAPHPYVLVGNHQSMFDILYLGAIFPKHCSIMAKKELRFTPLLGQFMTLANAVWVDRRNRQSALSTFDRVAEVMKKKGTSLFVFAEGTRFASKIPTLLPFKKGAFHLAVAGQVPIIPIVVENYWQLYSLRERRFDSGEIGIKVLPAIPTKGLTSSPEDIASLANQTREAMLDALEAMAQMPGSISGSTEIQRSAEGALALRGKSEKEL